MERSYVNQLAPAKKIGAMIFGEPKDGFTYALSTYSMNDTELDSKNDKASFAGRTTLNFAQLMGNKDAVMHLGLAGFDAEYNVTPTTSSGSPATETRANILAFRTPGRGLSSIFRAQIGGESVSTTPTLTSTSTSTSTSTTTVAGCDPAVSGTPCSATTSTTTTTTTGTTSSAVGYQGAISNSTSQVKSNAAGLEGAIALKNFKVQGEYTRANYGGNYNNGAESLDMDVKAMYGEVMWLVTGEKYADAYKTGSFGAIKPLANFDLDTNQLGAWEVGFRMEKYEVNDMAATIATNGTRVQGTATCTGTSATATASTAATINGCSSKSTTYTAGVKWILNPNLMVKLNYSRTNFGNEWEYYDLNDSQRLNKENIYMMRTQYAF
jgi:phosphate-selective porin OprO/OprP